MNGGDLEVNLTITQTENDCQASLADGVCLRYSVVSDERAVIVAYGVVPLSAMRVSHGRIDLHVDTRTVPDFTFVIGAPVVVSVSWQVKSGAGGALQRCATQGEIGAYAFASATSATPSGANTPRTGAVSSVNAGNTVVATIYLR